MIRKWVALIFAAALIAPGVFAQDSQRNPGRKNRRGMENQQKMSKQWAEAQAALKKKCPEEYAKIEELQKTNLFEAMMKFRELAAKEKISLGGDRRMRNGGRPGPDGMSRPDFGRGMPGGRPGFSMNFRNPRTEAEAQLKKEYPQDYAQVEALRKEAETKLQTLAKKAKVQLPDTLESYRMKLDELRQKYPAEMAEADKLKETDPRSANEKIQELAKKAGMELSAPFGFPGRPGARDGGGEEPPARRSNDMNKLYKVQKAYPEEWKRIRELRENDPAAARKQLLELIRKYDNDVKNKK